MITAVIACDKNGGIGLNGNLPWPFLQQDMKHFVDITRKNIVVMGYNTFKSINYKPLRNRFNIVLIKKGFCPKQSLINDNTLFINDEEFMKIIKLKKAMFSPIKKQIIIIGGAVIFDKYLPYIDVIHLTRIEKSFEADTFIDITRIENEYTLTNLGPLISENGLIYYFEYRISNKFNF